MWGKPEEDARLHGYLCFLAAKSLEKSGSHDIHAVAQAPGELELVPNSSASQLCKGMPLKRLTNRAPKGL